MNIFLLLFIFLFSVPDSEEEILQKGLEHEKNQHYQKALNIWATALNELDQPSPAIGREYIRLAAEQRLGDYYQTAFSMYRWGLSATAVSRNRTALEREILMLKPLANEKTYRNWRKLLEQGDPELFGGIRRFWQQLDPTPGTRYNERLLEHWERIAHAREHFTVSDNTVYGTDDRGTRWVQYGEPDRSYEGMLRLNTARIANFIEVREPFLVEAQQNALRSAAVMLHEDPGYEIWIYEEPNEDMTYNLVFIFGDAPSGGFKEQQTLDDFIPSRAFTFSNRYRTSRIMNQSCKGCYHRPKMTPGMILQFFYYEQLAARDFYFSHVFDRMTVEWEGDNRPGEIGTLSAGAGPFMKQRTRMATLQNLSRAPVQTSTYAEEFPEIPLTVYQYRSLNPQGRTVLTTFVESNPQQLFVEDLAANQDSMFSDESVSVAEAFDNYELYHGLQLRDESGEQFLQERLQTEFLIDSSGTVPSSSLFTIPFVSEQTEQVFYAEFKNMHPNSLPKTASPFPDELRGLGKVEIRQAEPLNSDPNTLEMGDVVLGYQMQQRDREGVYYPFVVANDLRIPTGEELAIHFEVYHLKPADSGMASFQLEYEILPADGGDWSRDRLEQSRLTLNFETDKTSYRENLSIRTAKPEPGKYLLRVLVTDRVSGQEISRGMEFTVINPDD